MEYLDYLMGRAEVPVPVEMSGEDRTAWAESLTTEQYIAWIRAGRPERIANDQR